MEHVKYVMTASMLAISFELSVLNSGLSTAILVLTLIYWIIKNYNQIKSNKKK